MSQKRDLYHAYDYPCVCFVPKPVHVWINNMEDIGVLPFLSFSASGDPHIVLFVIIHLVDFVLCNFFLWKTVLYAWTSSMRRMWWEAIINKTIHLFFFFLQKTIICFFRSRCASLCGFDIIHVTASFCFPTILLKSVKLNVRPGLWHWHPTDISPSPGY